jgi:hypothetical protein
MRIGTHRALGVRVNAARSIGLIAAIVALGAPSTALANGRYPAANQIVVSPNDARTMITRATFGLLVSHDTGATWDWVCEQALGFSSSQDPSLGLLRGDAIVVGTYGGLVVSPDTGCGWSFVGGALAGAPVVDIVVRRENPANALALTSRYVPSLDGGNASYRTQIYATTDGGTSWSAIGSPIDPTLIVETIEIARSDPQRIYVSGASGSGPSATAWLLVSNDSGATWSPQPIPFDPPNEHAPYIAAVDPSSADRVYVRTGGPTSSRLFVTSDAGKTFAQKWSGGPMLGFALTPDGAKIYVGGINDGVHAASTSDFAFTKTSPLPVQCLSATSTALYACSGDETGGFAIGVSGDDGATFRPVLHLRDIRGPLACAADASAAQCAQAWPGVRDGLGGAVDAGDGGGARLDAGVVAAVDASMGGADRPDGGASNGAIATGDGCDVAPERQGALSAIALAVATAFAARIRTRARPMRTRREAPRADERHDSA